MRACAHLFPEIAEWTVENLDQSLDDRDQLLLACLMPAGHFLRSMGAKPRILDEELLAPLCLQLHLHGEAVVDALRSVIDQVAPLKYGGTLTAALDIAGELRVPAVVPILARHVAHRKARDVLEKIARKYPAAVLKTAIEQQSPICDTAVEAWIQRLAANHADAVFSVMAALDDKNRRRFETVLAPLRVEEALPERLPSLLREDRPTGLPVIAGKVVATAQLFVCDEDLMIVRHSPTTSCSPCASRRSIRSWRGVGCADFHARRCSARCRKPSSANPAPPVTTLAKPFAGSSSWDTPTSRAKRRGPTAPKW